MTQKLAVVTGGAGFIGSHLCERLVKEGYKVISLDNYFAGSKSNHVAGVDYREGHSKDIATHITETPDIIFHLGEYSRVEQSVFEPEIVFDLNTIGTLGVLEFWRSKKCKLLYAGSSTKFGDSTSPYSVSKSQNTELVKKYAEWYDLQYAITYFYNVYGPRERAGTYGTVIEIFRQLQSEGAPLLVTSPGNQLRNFTHVYDIVDGLIRVGEQGRGDEYGLGSEREFSILDLARMFGGEIIMMPERKGNRMASALVTDKSRALGWSARHNLEDYVVRVAPTVPKNSRSSVIVFITTLSDGPAERALIKTMENLSAINFDVITLGHCAFTVPNNVRVHCVAKNVWYEKLLLPIRGYRAARALSKNNSYIFSWCVLASYGSLAALLLRFIQKTPILITTSGQKTMHLNLISRAILYLVVNTAEQVYGSTVHKRRSMGEMDAFANQVRFIYNQNIENKL